MMDTLTEQRTFPCESATDEELRRTIHSSAFGLSSGVKRLREITAMIPESAIPWDGIRHLFILGISDLQCNAVLESAGLAGGAYVDHIGRWLILIHPEEAAIRRALDRCSQLRSLRIDYGGPESLTLPSMSQLTKLDLAYCSGLTQLHGLENLTQLTRLDLAGCSGLTQLHGLENLTLLTELILYNCSGLTQLHGLENLEQLTELDLHGCSGLTQLHGLENLTQLTELNLHGCSGLREIPAGIRSIGSLRLLYLSRMELWELPDWLPEIAESFSLKEYGWERGEKKAIVYLFGTTVEDIADMSIFEQPYDMVVKWFDERRRGSIRTLNEIKVVFLGDGEAGKSHTIARLMSDGGDPLDYTDKSTPGIVIKNKDYTVEGRSFRVHYWDFGGQEIMHSMHRIFLTGRTMYVILLNARDDTQGDRAKYWLHNVKSFAPDAPVLLVLNKIDQNEKASVDEVYLRGQYEKLTQVVRISAKDFSQDEFNEQFTRVLLEEIQKTGYLDAQWPISWTQVKEKLENMETHYITGSEYETICGNCQVADNQKNLLHWFNDLGVSFCWCDEEDYALEDYVILRPDWITNALYIILFNHLDGAKNGLIPHSSIYQLLRNAHNIPNIRCTLPNARYNSSDIQYVLGVMRKFSLSFPHGEDHEFIPMLCQQNSTVDVQYYEKDADTLEFKMEFDYLPNNLLHRLMVERHSELDITRVWRTGASFRLDALGYSAVVVIDGNTLRFFIRHSDPMHRPNTYLSMLKANVDRIVEKMGLKAPSNQLLYKHLDKVDVFDYELVKAMRDAEQTQIFSMAWRKMIPIADILNQSAPDGVGDEMKLLDAVSRSCRSIQDERNYRLVKNENGPGYANGHDMEDLRNRRIRDDLNKMGFRASDQSQRGSSGTGKSIGEVDLVISDEQGELWTLIEALRVNSGETSEWKAHLFKLLNRYNSRGLPRVYLLTYVDADVPTFERIWASYSQTHIKAYHPDPYRYLDGTFAPLNTPNSTSYIKTARCQYSCGGEPITVYHIFACIPLKNE